METIFVFFIGAIFGSFINASAYRIVRRKDFIFERSCCPVCEHQLSFLDMIPIVSYFLKQGKCTYCKNKIAKRYLVAELLGGTNTVVCDSITGSIEIKFLYFIILNLLLFMSLVDIEIKEIKDSYQLILLIVATIIVSTEKWSINNYIGMIIISLPLLIIALITKSIGGADIKLFFILGLIAKTEGIIIVYLLTIVLAGGFALYKLIKEKNKKEEIALVPFVYLAFLLYKSFEKHLLICLTIWLT
ncbi:MAG: prepilin peptidase [Erysipelotrichia bacterium]|nr:prepilin peptidase [Erysipelotrichia bacterium]